MKAIWIVLLIVVSLLILFLLAVAAFYYFIIAIGVATGTTKHQDDYIPQETQESTNNNNNNSDIPKEDKVNLKELFRPSLKECRERYNELSLKYNYDSTGLSKEEKEKRDKEIAELIRLSIQNEFGCCYL